MTKRFYTCIIVQDASHRLHKLKIPQRAVHALAVVGVLSFFVAVALGFSYVHMQFKASDFKKLEVENTDLKIKTLGFQVSTSKLNSKISELETLSKKLSSAVENDPVYSQSRKLNVSPEGGSRTDITTSQLQESTDVNAKLNILRDRADGLAGQYNLLDQLIGKHLDTVSVTPNIWPIRGAIGSPFGSRLDPFDSTPDVHLGLDIVASVGSPVKSSAAGIVKVAQREGDYGNLVVIDHGHGLTTRYAHLRGFAVHLGQTVTKSQLIGWVGMTGRTTGPHLHYEVRLNDKAMNPRSYLPRGS
jgi:murein DD-endopeptidase MepM/ murein hydrolase activator NlpD